jgi:hypothetical protein
MTKLTIVLDDEEFEVLQRLQSDSVARVDQRKARMVALIRTDPTLIRSIADSIIDGLVTAAWEHRAEIIAEKNGGSGEAMEALHREFAEAKTG